MFNWLWLWWDGAGDAAVTHPNRYFIYRSNAESIQTSFRYTTQCRSDAESMESNFRYTTAKRANQPTAKGRLWQPV